MKLYIFIFCLLVGIKKSKAQDALHSDIIDGPANIRNNSNGEVLFTLYDNVAVSTTEIKDNWYEIGVEIKISKADKDLNNFILQDVHLVNSKNDTIGKSKNKIPILLDDGEFVFISGFTYVNNIKREFIPEVMLSNLINLKGYKTKKDFEGFIKKYGFKDSDGMPYIPSELDVYYIYDTILTEISPRDRISLLFKENILIGITHTRKINIQNTRTLKLIRGHQLTTFNKYVDNNYLELLKDCFVQSYGKMD